MRRSFVYVLRNAQAAHLAEVFFVSAIATIVAVRVFLYLSGYPQMGGGGLHIAHMLWGGLFMLAAFVLLLGSLNAHVRPVAAFVGGVGWGLFIDELGKFITADNNYFFRPTYALIYLVFVLLFFAVRHVFVRAPLSPTEDVVNALELLKEVAANDFSPDEKQRMVAYLQRANAAGVDVRVLLRYANSAEATGPKRRSYYARISAAVRARYAVLLRTRWFRSSIAYLFLLQLAAGAVYVGTQLSRSLGVSPFDPGVFEAITRMRFFDWGLLLSFGVEAVLVAVGLLFYWTSYARGLRWFRLATLFDILVGGFFVLYHSQLPALAAISVDVVVLYALNYILRTQNEAEQR